VYEQLKEERDWIRPIMPTLD